METLYDRPDVREALQALDAEALQAFARLLSPREAVVLHSRFLGRPPRMGVAREQVRRMEAEIIKKFEAWRHPH
jgi:hypothetical protein